MISAIAQKMAIIFSKNTPALNELSDTEFNVLLAELSSLIGPTFCADMCKYKTLERYCQHYGIAETHGALLREVFEQQIIRHTRLIALLQFRYMQRTDDWGDLGEQRILLSYCRQLLGLANDVGLTQDDVQRFEKRIALETQSYDAVSVADLRKADEAIRCNLFYKEIDYSKEKDVHALLDFLGSTKGFICGQLSIFRSIIFGEADIQDKNGYRVTTFKTEIARTPASVLSIAAVVGGKHIAIRVASCETIFANKWQGLMLQPGHNLFFDLMNDCENASVAFKIRALQAYDVQTYADLIKKRQLFLAEMVDGLLWHELGHGIVINGRLEVEDSAFGEALGVWGANVISVMKEILADWAPREGELTGPLYYMSYTEPEKLKRMIYVYLSDNWFLGTQEDAFANHTEIMLALILKYLNNDGTVNQQGLQQAFEKQTVFDYVLAEYMRISRYLETKIKALPDFANLRVQYVLRVREIDKENEENSLEFLVLLWAKLLEDLPQLYPELVQELQNYLALENEKFHKYLVQTYHGAAAQNLREFVLEQLRLKKFYINTENLSAQLTVEDLLQEIG